MNQQMIDTLFNKACEATNNSYTPYSHFQVGAAILLTDGNIICGGNIENISFGATNCAERTAIFNAITAGYRKGDFQAIAIYGNTEEPISPCGICRQVMVEFFTPDTPILLFAKSGKCLEMSLNEIMPYAFNDLK